MNNVIGIRCLAAMAAIAWATTTTHSAVTVYVDEASFMTAADVVSTETFSGFGPTDVLGVGRCEVDQIVYTASAAASQWRMAGMGFIEQYRYRIGTPGAIDEWDSLTFGPGQSTTAVGFLLSVTGPYDMLFDVETTSGAVTTVQVPGAFAVYRGFTADEGIVSVTIRDYPDDGHLANFYLDDVSRGAVVPEPATLAILALGGLAMRRRKRQ